MAAVNECIPITIFPLGIACQTTNPSGPTASDGSIILAVTGGTPPYSVTWENGNSSLAIDNLSVGSYPVTVVDYYGDFTATTACVLSATTTTTSTSTTTTTLQPTFDFCMSLNYFQRKLGEFVNLNIHFNPNGLFNGYQSWISDDTNYGIVWDVVNNFWEVTGVTPTVINSNPAYPPLSGWQVLGVDGSAIVYEGECLESGTLIASVSTNPAICSKCVGVITFNAVGGTPPYQYSIDGGNTWVNNSIFNSLCPSVNFYPKVKDSDGNIITPTNSNIIFPPQPTTAYTLSINTVTQTVASGPIVENKVYTTTFTVSPPLPIGVTISFNVSNLNQFIRTPFNNSYVNNTTYTFTKNGNPITQSSQNTSNTDTPNTNDGCEDYDIYTTITQTNWNGITIGNGDIITLIVSSTKSKNNIISCFDCCSSTITNTLNVTGVKTSSNCTCCQVLTNQNG